MDLSVFKDFQGEIEEEGREVVVLLSAAVLGNQRQRGSGKVAHSYWLC